MKLKVGEILPFFIEIENNAIDKVVKGSIKNMLTGAILKPDIDLSFKANRVYSNENEVMPGVKYVRVLAEVFESDGVTPSNDTSILFFTDIKLIETLGAQISIGISTSDEIDVLIDKDQEIIVEIDCL